MAYESLPMKQQPVTNLLAPASTGWKVSFRHAWQKHRLLFVLLIPAVIWLLVFRLYPFWGISIAFVKFNPIHMLDSQWVGLNNFIEVFRRQETTLIIRNTIFISLGKIILGELAGLAFALVLHETQFPPYRKLVLTVSTIPHFFSWIIMGALTLSLLGSKGSVNDLLGLAGLSSVKFLADKTIFPFTLIFTDVWKEFGWSAVIYMAALTQINNDLLEAAAVDGADRIARLFHIILPTILPTFIFMLALGLGNILEAGFDQILVLYNPSVYSTGDVLDTYVYRMGLVNFKFEIATVVGIIKAIVGFMAIMSANWAAGKLSNYRMF
jgi:putative aldouronate transport system permease protein